MGYTIIQVPEGGEKIRKPGKTLIVPDNPIIPFIEGDGTGPDIWRASVRVFDAAVEKAYRGKRKIFWMEVYAGEKAYNKFGSWLPEETIQAFKEFLVGIKGPLTTPVGGGIRSLNVAIRKALDLYVCQRPVRWFPGVPSPIKHPEWVDMVIFRENTEDIYAGIEFEMGSPEWKKFMELFKENFPEEYAKMRFPNTSGIGIKPVSEEGTKRLVRAAIQWGLDNNRRSVTLVHKGNIMKYTEGAFRQWGYEVAAREFAERTVTEAEIHADERQGDLAGIVPPGAVLVNDRIADAMFQELILRPERYDVLALSNLNGDYISDAAAALVGGLGLAPGANVGARCAVFEATHGTAPDIAGRGLANPGSLILSGALLLRHLGWTEAADRLEGAVERVLAARRFTADLAAQAEPAEILTTRAFGRAVATEVS